MYCESATESNFQAGWNGAQATEQIPPVQQQAFANTLSSTLSSQNNKVMATVLLVDDDPTILKVLSRMLKMMGYTVLRADGGEAALPHLHVPPPVSVVLLDINMPGISGFDLLSRIRSDPTTSKVAVVMYTAADTDEYRQRAGELGATDYWVKSRMNLSEIEYRLRALCEAA